MSSWNTAGSSVRGIDTVTDKVLYRILKIQVGRYLSIMTKMINNKGLEGLYLNIIKVIYYKPATNLIPNIEKLKMLPLKLEIRQG